MQTKHKISAAQFFITMFVSRAVITIALNAQYTGGENLLDNTVSYVLAMLLGFLIALPIWGLHKRYPDFSVNEVAKLDLGKAGRLVPLCYILYFILVNAASLALFEIFLLDTVNPDFSAAFVAAAVVGVALYGAFRGLETVSRCATCVFVALLAGCLLVFGIVAARFQADNLEPLFYNGWSQTAQGVALFIARTSIFADMAILLPQVKGRKKLGFACWSGGTALFVCTLILLLVGCLGRYAYTQNFPVYALASITEVRSMQRLDAVFIGVWMMGLIIKLACDIYACRVCFSSLTKKRRPGITVPGTALVILALALWAAASMRVQHVLLDTRLLFLCTVFTGFLVPLLVLIGDSVKHRKKKDGR